MAKRDIKQQVQTRFGEVAANYRISAVHASGADLEVMARNAPLRSNSVVLDAGCGAGHTAMAFAPNVAWVYACDFTGSMLKQVKLLARQRGVANVTPQLADIEYLPFPDDSFDIVTSRYSAHHWGHPQKAISEIRRVLRKKGSFIISDIMASEDYAQDTFLQTIELLRDPSHVRDYRISEWRALLSASGFRAEVIHKFELELHFRTWTTRMETPRQNREMIKSIFSEASQDIRRGFQLPDQIDSDDFSFFIPGAVIKCQTKV
ncbi:MAG: class I SAM-dependent methyltransferase [Chloroflexi bacterium]|nr:class I SAM-dependent methyltransferase [Chloroflexota bacterium]